MILNQQYLHDCTADTLVAVIAGDASQHAADIYRQCGGYGYIVRFSHDGPDYTSSEHWTLRDALEAAMRLEPAWVPASEHS